MTGTQEPIRFATFNASLNRNEEGQLIDDLSTPANEQARNVAEIIQRTNPDVVLINEFDFEPNDTAAKLFRENYLEVSQNGANPIEFPYVHVDPSNTGIPAGFDLDNDGSVGGPNDAFGFGFFPGQFGMALYSKYPIDTANIRTFQDFLWKDMPGALLPDDPATPEPNDWYSPEELEVFRLSSKSHWDIPVNVNGQIVHVLASHPTPPVFDGDEDRNGTRNHDEIRFWSDYVTPGKGDYIYDDAGNLGGITPGSRFVIMGDQNADPFDGDSTNDAILQLLDNPLINTSVTPDSNGGPDAAVRQDAANDTHLGNPAFDTADFADTTPGNLRADYVLPSQNLEITDAAVFWPKSDNPLFPLVGDFDPALPGGFPSSDHRLVWADVTVPNERKTVSDVDFIGEVTFPTRLSFKGTEVGGLSGLTYDPSKNLYYSISDDRSQINPARFYTLDINLSDGELNNEDVTFQNVTTLLNASGQPFPESSLDPEGISLTDNGTVFISSEGSVAATPQINPFVNEFSLTGEQLQALPVPQKFLPTTGDRGIRDNLAFESVTITPDQKFLYTATENALAQDGAIATTENGSPSRILKYNLVTGTEAEFLYETDPVAAPPIPADQFSTNGLVELLALDNSGTLLALERSFSVGVGNNIKLYEVRLQGATDISGVDSVDGLEVGAVAQKRLLLDFAELGVPLDNIEGITLGPTLPDGRQSLVVVSDNNFSETQFTQFLAFAVDTNTIPEVLPALETPQVIDLDQPPNNQQPGDADDPAIYVHPTDAAKSLVIGTLKDGGLSVYDLNGQVTQTISPDEPGDVRFNNVDLVYGFNLGNQSVDLAVASDRENDTLAIFKVDPTTRQLTDITDDNITASIFGVDDGEQTAYGLATYTSPVSGKSYVFVSQREGNKVAQLELVDDGTGQVNANLVRSLTVPIPTGGELEDAQVEGMVADRELGYLYVGQEKGGIFKFSAETEGGDIGRLIEAVKPDGSNLEADVEGLTIYYAADGKGYLLASSQGDSTYAAFTREGDNAYLGNFAIGESGGVDSVEESDGADVINVPLGPDFPSGLLVVQDGSNEPAVVVNEDGEVENVSSNFKFVPWENVANAFPNPLAINTTSFDPRAPLFNSVDGTDNADDLTGSFRSDRLNGFKGDDTITGLKSSDLLTGGGDNDTFVINLGDGIDTVTDFSGVGTGGKATPAELTEVDTVKFQGEELIANNMLLTQNESDLVISFEDIAHTQVILNDFNLENLDNLQKPTNANPGNILFNGQNQIQDNFDVFNADSQRQRIFHRDSVTFLNDLDNNIKGFNRSEDVINGQGGDDIIKGLSGDDLLRGAAGNDTLSGGKGSDRLLGGDGDDLLNGSSGNDSLQGEMGQDTLIGGGGSDLFGLSANQGVDTISDFNISQQDRIGLAGVTFEQLVITQGTASNTNNTTISVLGQDLLILTGIQASSLGSNNFILV